MNTARNKQLHTLQEQVHDVLIIGGGINGASCAAILSAHGIKTALIDAKDFASGTSQESSNLIWGGIKYLESFELKLVYDLCRSRNRLMRAYPTHIQENRFLVAIDKHFRFPLWFLYLGTLVYWFIGKAFTKMPSLHRKNSPVVSSTPINTTDFPKLFEYSDARLVEHDAQFTFSFIQSAIRHQSPCCNYIRLTDAQYNDSLWHLTLKDEVSQKVIHCKSRYLLNAAGPYVDDVLQCVGLDSTHQHVFSRGIHLLVPRIHSDERILTFFDDTGRLFFVIPFNSVSMIGTTDVRVEQASTEASQEERLFLLENVNKRLKLDKPLSLNDVISERCGVRPLVTTRDSKSSNANWFQLSRKHQLVDHGTMLSLYGGKITDCLNLAEEVLDCFAHKKLSIQKAHSPWYGEPGPLFRIRYEREVKTRHLQHHKGARSDEPLTTLLWRRYGLSAFAMLDRLAFQPDLAQAVVEGGDLFMIELSVLKEQGCIVTLEDLLRRRSSLALTHDNETLQNSQQLYTVCCEIFGDHAHAAFDNYFSMQTKTQKAS